MANRRNRRLRAFASIWYVPPIARYPTINPFFIIDSSAFLVIILSVKHRGLMRAHGMPSLLDNIVQDATVYFLVIFTGHLLVVFFELLTHVSDRPADLCSFAHDELHIGTSSNSSRDVSHHLECRNKDELTGCYTICSVNAV